MKDYVSPKNINTEVGMHRRRSGRIIRSFFAFSGIRPDNPVFFAISGVRPDNPFFFAISGIRPDNWLYKLLDIRQTMNVDHSKNAC